MTATPDRYALAQRIYDDYHARIIAGGGEAEHAFRFALQELVDLPVYEMVCCTHAAKETTL